MAGGLTKTKTVDTIDSETKDANQTQPHHAPKTRLENMSLL